MNEGELKTLLKAGLVNNKGEIPLIMKKNINIKLRLEISTVLEYLHLEDTTCVDICLVQEKIYFRINSWPNGKLKVIAQPVPDLFQIRLTNEVPARARLQIDLKFIEC